ncbi:hypothetical protein L915_11831 [Phytophthora nicotianae]|uniref:Uncharacterized protein n=1 Tax=Phytophthora nicotianae TaxID=4792 RepID=W2GKU7_PHYNI|nr:hypothetical protein L915_11831 [Phytophthora nicotianae]
MTSTSHAVLVQLRKERRVYEDVMRARCLTSGEDYDTVTRLVEDSFERKLLETWCRIRWQAQLKMLMTQGCELRSTTLSTR